jgi:hypothetical protein
MYCKANGMDLFDISSKESKAALFDYATELFGESIEIKLHVKGRAAGECQYIDNANGSFNALYGYCNLAFYLFCGFQNPSPSDSFNLEKSEGEFLFKTVP